MVVDEGENEEEQYRESFGDFLKRHREGCGKSLDVLARSTRIPKRFLQAFEDNDSARFPEPTFTRGFLRSYAQEIGLEVEEVLARYERFQRSIQPTQIKDMRKTIRAAELSSSRRKPLESGVWFWWAAVALVGLVSGGLYFWGTGDQSASEPEAEAISLSPLEPAAEVVDAQPSQPSTPLAIPSPPSELTIKALRRGSLNVRVDENAPQDLAFNALETKTLMLYKEVEVQGVQKENFQILYNGKPVDLSSSTTLKLFNRNLYTSSSSP